MIDNSVAETFGALTVSGAYGRDYTSQKKVLEDWNANKDFVIRTMGPNDGRYINKPQAVGMIIMCRYSKDTKIMKLPTRG